MKRAILAALLVVTTAILAGTPAKAGPPSYGPDLDLNARGWKTFSGGPAIHLANDPAGGLYLDVPVMPDTSCGSTGRCDSIGYLFTERVPSVISGALIVTLKVDTAGDPAFQFFTEPGNTCPAPPASVRPFIWAHNNSYADGARWWAHYVSYVLAPGTVTLMVPLDPSNFSGVLGEMADQDAQTLAWWYSALSDVSSLGVTFGGGCFYGHGVYVTGGTSRFTLQDYDVAAPCPSVTPCPRGSCVRSSDFDATSTGLGQCYTADGEFLNCDGGQTVNVVSSHCDLAPCCFTQPACVCGFDCPDGQYLECR